MSATQEPNNNSADMHVCTTSQTDMDLDDNEKEHTAKKIRTTATPMVDVSQTPLLEENSGNNSVNLGESPETPKNPTMTSSDSSNKTKQKNFPGPVPAPMTFSHDNPYVNHWTNTTTQHTDQLTTTLQPLPSDPSTEPDTASGLTSHDTTNKQSDTDMEITSDITVESESEPLHHVTSEATLAKPTYSAIASGRNTTTYNGSPRRETAFKWKDQVKDKLIEIRQNQRVENFDEEIWHTDKILEILNSKENLIAFTRHKLNTNPTNIQIPTAINTKLRHKDTAFFRSFTRTTSAQAPHQIEFSTLLNKAIDRYKRLHNIPMTNKTNRDQIFFGLRQKIAIDFLKNLEFLKLNGHEITCWIFYLWGFGKLEKHIDFITARTAINDLLNETIIPLPEQPNDIDSDIRSILPFQLPIVDRYHTRQIVNALHLIFTFHQLPETYFENTRIPLPSDPEDLTPEITNHFPITNYTDLKSLPEYCRELRNHYTFKELPPSYFALPEVAVKPQLPLTPQELDKEIRHLFPFTARDELDFRRHIDILKEYYRFKRLPNDYIRQKKRLPKEPSELKLKNEYKFPLTDLTTVRNFIAETIDEYHIPEPLPGPYTDINFTNKPELPWDYRKVREVELNIPITNPKELVTTARKLRRFYFFRQLPQTWIKIPTKERNQSADLNKKPRLPNDLETLKEIIGKTLPDLPTDLPISDYDKIIPTIDVLRENFDFRAAPSYLFHLLDRPKPEWDLYDYDDAYD